MAIHVRVPLISGLSYSCAIERLSDGLYYDWGTQNFLASPTTRTTALTESPGGSGIFKLTYGNTPSNVWIDGQFSVEYYQAGVAASVGTGSITVFAGSDAPVNFPLLHAGIAQGGSGTTITLDAAASSGAGAYGSCVVSITAGTGAGQGGIITAYNPSTKVATVNAAFSPAPDATSVFSISGLGSIPGASAPTVGQIVAGVYEEPKAAHTTPGTYGYLIDAQVSSRMVQFTLPVNFSQLAIQNLTGNVTATNGGGGGGGGQLNPDGLDLVIVAASADNSVQINARQALNAILSSLANLDESQGNLSLFYDPLQPSVLRIKANRLSTGRTGSTFTPPA